MKARLVLRVNIDYTGYRTYGYFVGYTEKGVKAIARCFPKNWEWYVERE